MNKTFERAFCTLSDSERKALISRYGNDGKPGDAHETIPAKDTGTSERLTDALMKLFTALKERTEGDLKDLSPFEEKVMAQVVAAGNAGDQDNFYR